MGPGAPKAHSLTVLSPCPGDAARRSVSFKLLSLVLLHLLVPPRCTESASVLNGNAGSYPSAKSVQEKHPAAKEPALPGIPARAARGGDVSHLRVGQGADVILSKREQGSPPRGEEIFEDLRATEHRWVRSKEKGRPEAGWRSLRRKGDEGGAREGREGLGEPRKGREGEVESRKGGEGEVRSRERRRIIPEDLVQLPQSKVADVCWRSHSQWGSPAMKQGSTQSPLPGLSVFGAGCSRCTVGSFCSFTVGVAPPVRWAVEGAEGARRELNVVLRGPSLAAGLASTESSDDSTFVVTYRVWEAGTYRVSLRASCHTLNISATPDTTTAPFEVASWDLTVLVPSTVQALANPCALHQFGRWLLVHEEYTWAPFPCARTEPPSNWLKALNQKGIFEITFVGDSHQRVLLNHLRYILTGQCEKINGHYSFTLRADGQDGAYLILYLAWVPGIFSGDDIFGCKMIERKDKLPPHPPLPLTSQVYLVDAGFWTGAECLHPNSAFSAYLPQFLMWARERLDFITDVQRGTPREHPGLPLLMYRTAPPHASEDSKYGCSSRFTNRYLQTANELARLLLPHFDIALFDSWLIEMPRFTDNCPRDHHYSCRIRLGEDGKQCRMEGPVGEAVVSAFVHHLLNVL